MRYELIDGLYVLQEPGRTHPPLQEIAIGYMSSKKSSNLSWRSQRHGDSSVVKAWAEKARQLLSKTGPVGKAMAAEIHVISGQLDLDDLNAVLKDPKKILALVKNAVVMPEKSVQRQIKVDGKPIQKEDENE